MSLVEKAVQFEAGAEPQIYHCITQADYVTIVAIREDGMIPIVKQFRPCVGKFTWEFPAGTVDKGETPRIAAQRELNEEVGLFSTELIDLGSFQPDTGRLELASHAFFAPKCSPAPNYTPEEGLEVRFVSPATLREMMLSLEFAHQLHWGIWASAVLRGIPL